MSQILDSLVQASTPFLQIDAATPRKWMREMSNPRDGRIGPWNFEAQFTVLDAKTWSRTGEVLYFLTDHAGHLRLVGESSGKLKWRWKEVPMTDVATRELLGRRALFHTTAWPAIEAGMSTERAPFTVRALFRPELEALCRTLGGPLSDALAKPEDKKKLSYHVEAWIREAFRVPLALWNRN